MATSPVPPLVNTTRGASFFPKNGVQHNRVETEIVQARREQAEEAERVERRRLRARGGR